ncbi:BA75_02334T0 [Komagataella pastoris]|uniref:BA75_02334T0 n=1 Tax=Komagataella pastoris TaxID=4922 RepID=A0A1B2JAE4_PICPA|nr:BA75_02334T0 [Komagataella pastoris]
MPCYKSKSHKHPSIENQEKEPLQDLNTARTRTDVTESVLHDSRLVNFLKEPTLRFHLKVLYELLNDPQLTNETSADARREIANKKLVNLRLKGSEENQLVEKFCSRVLEFMDQ